MTQSVRPRLHVECLEGRDLPSGATSQLGSTAAGLLPGGWSQWSNTGTAAFTSVLASAASGSTEFIATGTSNTTALAWQTAQQPGDTTVSAEVELNSLVPTFVFSRGANLGTATPSYLAAVVTRGATASIVQVANGVATTLGSVSSPSTAYFSNNWVQVSLVPSGSGVAVQVIREDTGAYLNAQGLWQSGATNALVVTTTLPDNSGDIGIGRAAAYSGTVDIEDFTSSVPVSPPPTPTAGPAVNQSFDATAIGTTPAGWQTWINKSAGTAGVGSVSSLSTPNGYALTGASNTAERAWSTTALPTAVSAAVAIDLNSLIPAQLFVDGENLDTTTPTYDAVTLTHGVQASLVQVIDGTTTTLATIKSSGYLSGAWVEVELTAQGTDLLATIYRTDTDQWLTASGSWSSTPSYALSVTNAVSLAAGEAGIGRLASYAGTVAFDNFTAGAVGTVGPSVTINSSAGASSVAGSVTFEATATGNVSQMVLVLNGQVEASSTASSLSWTLNSTDLDNGSYTLTVLSAGTDGTVGAGMYSFTVANSPAPVSPLPTTTSSTVPVDANPASAVGYSAAPSTDTLFGPNGPSYLDVEQGQEGDCWLIASLAEVAAQAPQDIVKMFTYDGTTVENGVTVGVYTVRFYTTSGMAKYVTIDTELPEGGNYYDQPVNGVMWVALAEKAYAVANGLGYVASADPDSNSYEALNAGYASWAIQAITGTAATDSNVNPTQIATAWSAGEFIVLSTVSPGSSYIVGDHEYAVVGYNAASGQFTFMNPWGGSTTSTLCPQDTQVYGLFSANASFVAANFSIQSVGTAAPSADGSILAASTGLTSSPGQIPVTGSTQVQQFLGASNDSAQLRTGTTRLKPINPEGAIALDELSLKGVAVSPGSDLGDWNGVFVD